jgi:PhnB protein
VGSQLNPYISFNGTAREAMEFYKSVFGGDLSMNTFGDFGDKDAEGADKIMHARLETDSGYTIMSSDNPPGQEARQGDNISVSLSGDDRDELSGYFQKLSEGGSISVPLEKQMWGDEFGMCTDKFGINWMVNIGTPR